MWQKILSTAVAAVMIISLVFFLNFDGNKEEKECCLCHCFRYHAPCLIDLETGDLVELEIYFPHHTKVAELAQVQPDQDSFTLFQMGNAHVYIDESQERAVLDIPIADRTWNPSLCAQCRKKLSPFHTGRYVLADLYAALDDRENHKLIPIVNGMHMELRCYTITANKEEDHLKLIIQGNLEQ